MTSLQRLRKYATGGRDIPNYEEDPLAWNAAWEVISLESTLLMYNPRATSNRFGEPDEFVLEHYREIYYQLCAAQYTLTVQVANHLAEGFEEQWRAATMTVRRDHIVEAHIRMAILGREVTRSFCGELTVASLAERNSGEGLLKLLRIYIHEDTSSMPTTPISFPYNRSSGIRLSDTTPNDAWRAIFELDRDLYICLFLLHTLKSWNNESRPAPLCAVKTSVKGDLHPAVKQVFKATLGSSGLKEIKQEMRAENAAAVRSCESCRKLESTTKYMQCKICADAAKRRTFYCSKKCQKDDWPRHKMICGKSMTFETARNMAIAPATSVAVNARSTRPQIGPVIGGYNRSPALIAQVHRLNFNPGVDYYIANSSLGGFTAFSATPAPQMQSALREIRDRALTTGDRSAAAALGEFLVVFGIRFVREGLLLRQGVMNQLVLEFGEHIKEDMHVLEVIAYHDPLPDRTQLERKMEGNEIYDVLVLPKGWKTLEAHFKMFSPYHDRSADAPWNSVFSP